MGSEKNTFAKSQKINSSSHVATDKLIDRKIPSLKKLYPSKFLSGKHDMSISVLLRVSKYGCKRGQLVAQPSLAE